MEKKEQSAFLSIVKAAEVSGLSARTIQKYIASGQLSARKIGRRRLIELARLREFLAADQPVSTRGMTDSPSPGRNWPDPYEAVRKVLADAEQELLRLPPQEAIQSANFVQQIVQQAVLTQLGGDR